MTTYNACSSQWSLKDTTLITTPLKPLQPWRWGMGNARWILRMRSLTPVPGHHSSSSGRKDG